MNLSTIIMSLRARKAQIAVEGLQAPADKTGHEFGRLTGLVQGYEEIIQVLAQAERDAKYEDPIG